MKNKSINEVLLSIIIPCYNVEKYLPCLLSQLEKVSLDTIELIFIDDASVDTTKSVIKVFKRIHPEFDITLLTNKYNTGQSVARNKGINIARGTYIWFLDSDDMFSSTVFTEVIKTLVNQKPELLFTSVYSFLDRNIICSPEQIKEHDIKTKEEYSFVPVTLLTNMDEMLNKYFHDVIMYPYSVLMHKNCINNIRFPVGKTLEDVMTMPKFISTAQSYYYINKPLVYYRRRENSTMSTPKLETFIDYSRAMYDVVKFFQTKTLSEQTRQQMFLCYVTILRWSLNDMVKLKLLNSEAWKYYDESINMFKSENPYSWIDLLGITIKSYPVQKALMTLLFLISTRIYAKLYKILA